MATATPEPAAAPAADAPGAATAGARRASPDDVRLMGCGLIVLALLLAYLLIVVWPASFQPGTAGSEIQKIHPWLGSDRYVELTADVQLLLMVMITGGLGSFVHTATSFTDFVGNEKLTRSWIWWYLLKPFIGMALALIFYVVVRGGLMAGGTEAGKLNVYGIAALAGLAGMFSKQATDKLSEVFDTLFRTAPGVGDAKRKDDLNNVLPVLTELDRPTLPPATPDLALVLKGSNFVKTSVVRVNGVPRDTVFKDESTLQATLRPEDVAHEGRVPVTVFNPPPGGGLSAALFITIGDDPAAGAPAPPAAPAAEDHLDGCGGEVQSVTPDEALPPARGGVSTR